MSRAIRRSQAAGPKQQQQQGQQRPPRLGGSRAPQQTRGARPPERTKRRLRIPRPRWFEDVWSELKKVTWPSRDETVYLTTVVIIVALTVGAMLGGVDAFFNWLIDRLLLR
jgi:preprotein translocase subunit SecE